MFPVLNSFMKTRSIVKSNERKSVLFTGHDACYNRHVLISTAITQAPQIFNSVYASVAATECLTLAEIQSKHAINADA